MAERKINGVLVFTILFIVIAVATISPAVNKTYCSEETPEQNPEVIMLSAWWCPYCFQARKYFTKNEIQYCEYDMENSETGKKLYENANGQVIPVIFIGNQQINGFNEKLIELALSNLEKNDTTH